jgi:hypothetical protein
MRAAQHDEPNLFFPEYGRYVQGDELAANLKQDLRIRERPTLRAVA